MRKVKRKYTKKKEQQQEVIDTELVGVENCDFAIKKRTQDVTVPDDNEWTPSEQQVEVIRLWLDMEQRLSISELCDKAGINRRTWYRWKQNPHFRKYFHKLLSLEVEVEPVIEAWRCLYKAAKRGNVLAATKILEVTGMFTPKVKHEFSGDPENPIRTEIYVPQFNMPPPPQRRDRQEEAQEFLEDLQQEQQKPKSFEESLMDDEDI
jgi:hypothetical protein